MAANEKRIRASHHRYFAAGRPRPPGFPAIAEAVPWTRVGSNRKVQCVTVPGFPTRYHGKRLSRLDRVALVAQVSSFVVGVMTLRPVAAFVAGTVVLAVPLVIDRFHSIGSARRNRRRAANSSCF